MRNLLFLLHSKTYDKPYTTEKAGIGLNETERNALQHDPYYGCEVRVDKFPFDVEFQPELPFSTELVHE